MPQLIVPDSLDMNFGLVRARMVEEHVIELYNSGNASIHFRAGLDGYQTTGPYLTSRHVCVHTYSILTY